MKLPAASKKDRERLAPHLGNYHKVRAWLKTGPRPEDIMLALRIEAEGYFRQPVVDTLVATACCQLRSELITAACKAHMDA
jgi:hypothetical protein